MPSCCCFLSHIINLGGERKVDINNAFLQGYLMKDVFMVHPLGFISQTYPNHVCKLCQALYSLEQPP
ncbi:hypothetical protein L6452_08577 [Arctium lappa]|uniref:Uncharacterized protein n=1 Tax=Arctium lappa TaxID=4217 RepID=A0ACB9DHM6_ARCLA|nr:hypothetical protein L6452_08577 [Arctium lappa]